MTDKLFYNGECIAEFPAKSLRLNIGDQVIFPVTSVELPEPVKVIDITIQHEGEAHIYVK